MPSNTAIKKEIGEVLAQIEATPGWTVDINDASARVTPPPGDGRPFNIHLTPPTFNRGFLMTYLRSHGWTPTMQRQAVDAEREARVALHNIEARKIQARIDRINQEADSAMAASRPTSGAPQFSSPATTELTELPFGAVPGPRPPHSPYWVKITREWANEMILLDSKIRAEDGTLNRKVSVRRVEDYMREIQEGRWKKVHQGYAFTRQGKILDGQHRLLAVQATGKTIYGWCYFGVDEETFDVIDTGRPRTVADALHVSHEVNTAVLAAAVRLFWLHRNFDEFDWNGIKRVSAANTRDLLAEHPGLRDAVAMAGRHGKLKRIMRVPAMAVAVYLCLTAWPQGEEKMVDFLYGTATGLEISGDGLRGTDPRMRLRNLMEGFKYSGKQRDNRFHVAVFIKAWNYFCKGQGVSLLAIRDNERIQDPYTPDES